MIELSLVVPGLLGPWPESAHPGFPVPRAPNLGRLLASSRRLSAGNDFCDVVLALHGYVDGSLEKRPIASLSYLADGGHRDEKRRIRLDLVHLNVLEGVVPTGGTPGLQIGESESQQLWQLLEPYFDTAGWQVEPLQPGRWYLALEPDSPVHDRNLIESMEGRRQGSPVVRHFVAQLTEIQMLLHAAEVNHDREKRGIKTINALWPVGGDILPRGLEAAHAAVFSSDIVVAGLAVLTREKHSNELPKDFPGLVSKAATEKRVLATLEEMAGAVFENDPSHWSRAVERFDRDWAAPILAALRYGKMHRLTLYTCDGRSYRISPPRAWLAGLRGGDLCRHF